MIVQNVGHGGATDLSFTVPRVELAAAKQMLEPLVRDLGAREHDDRRVASPRSRSSAPGIHNAPGYAARMFGTLADAGVNIEMISTSEVRITCIIAEDRARDRAARAPRRLRARAARDRSTVDAAAGGGAAEPVRPR